MMRLSGKSLLIASLSAFLISCPSLGSHQPALIQPSDNPPAADAAHAGGTYAVPQDVYSQTFVEVEALISRLNEIISEKDYSDWLQYLSPDYIEKTGSPEYLREASKSPILESQKIVLRSLEDYFLHVVVPSRVQVTLDDISFIDQTHVKAISLINGRPVILYWLVWIDSRWMIGVP